MNNKKAFSFVELLIVISIVLLLAVVAFSLNSKIKAKTENARIGADLITLENALKTYKNEKNTLPSPKGNLNYFTASGTYAEDKTNAFGVYGKATEDLLPKSYLDQNLLDPRTNNYYSYGITSDKNEFEVAGVLMKDDTFVAKVEGIYKAENGPYNLIREYNGANFVMDNGRNLPYNPYEKKLIATDQNGKIYQVGDTITTGAGEELELYFSDGSVSKLMENSSLKLTKLDFPNENNLISKVELTLNAGVIWTKATRLFGDGETQSDSEFTISTEDTVAAVRGTIFKVGKGTDTEVSVVEGKVKVKLASTEKELTAGQQIEVKDFNQAGDIIPTTETPPVFTEPESVVEVDNTGLIDEVTSEKVPCFLDGVAHYEDEESFKGFGVLNTNNGTCPPQELKCENGEVVVFNQGDSRDFSKKYNFCCLYVDEKGSCVRGDKDLEAEGYKLVAYVPYDSKDLEMLQIRPSKPTKKSFSMYMFGVGRKGVTNDVSALAHGCDVALGESIDDNGGCDELLPGFEKIRAESLDPSYDKERYRHPFYTDGVTTGVFIDNDNSDDFSENDYLKYDIGDLELLNSFVVEMRVRVSSDQSSGGPYYLFDMEDKLYLYIESGEIKINGTSETIDNNIFDNKFHTFIIKVENGEIKNLKVDDETKIITGVNNISNVNKIVVGANYSYIIANATTKYTNQLNNLIDYIKIYKKN